MHPFFEDTHNDSHNWIEALFDHATIGIVVTHQNGKIVNFNKQAEKDFGYTKQEVMHQPMEILLPPSIKARHETHRKAYYQNPTPRSMGQGRDLYAQKKDKSVFPVEISLSNYNIGNQMFTIAFVINISVRKQQEQIVLKQKEELELIAKEITQLNITLEKKIDDRTKMLRETLSALEQSKIELSDALKAEKDLGDMKSKFVSMASHEFKTPLSTILSSSFLLEKYNQTNDADKRTKHINRIKHAVNDMRMILDDFLSADKLDEGIVHKTPSNLSADAIFKTLDDVVQKMSVLCKDGQQIIKHFSGKHDILVDERLLQSICTNLLSNAIKFSPEQSNIEVSCLINEKELQLSVKDYGIGIAKEDQLHLFERFFRAKNATNIQGTGLGLNIVQQYVKLLNGSIKFESEFEKGSTFIIHIPQ